MIERLTSDTLEDVYFNNLFIKASRLLASKLFSESNDKLLLSTKELSDLLRFSDILSNSKSPKARNKAYHIITLLNEEYKGNPFYKTFSHSVLAKLGNFPAIKYLQEINGNNSELPHERDVEKRIKAIVQSAPETEDIIFTDSQYELYTQISESKFFSFSGPTSMGKSFIIKAFIRKALSNKPPENIVILVPTRALINQFSIDLNKELKDTLDKYGYKVATNSNVSELPDNKKQLYVFVLTPERLISYLSQKTNPPIGYLFVDEAHKIAAEKDLRSITSYNSISKSLRMYPNLNLYFSSPNVSNPEVFLGLFKKDTSLSYKTIEAPVSQNLFFINLIDKKITHYVDSGNYDFTPQILKKATSYDIIKSIGESNNNIVYCSSRYSAVDKASHLYSTFSKDDGNDTSPNVKKAIRQIESYIHKDFYLAEYLSKGIAYHFGNLPQIIRNKVEALFKNSEINFVFCTSTLLEGVNLPAKNVFILNDKNGRQQLEAIDFWNLAGRAGRLKYELSGNIFCIKENESDWKHMELLNKNPDIILKPTVENIIDKKLKKIEKLLQNDLEIKNETEAMKEILQYIANVISIDTLEIDRANYSSEIINKLINENKEKIIELAKKNNGDIEVPSSILTANQSIKLQIQNEVFKELKKKSNKPELIKLPTIVDYETCKSLLHQFYKIFKWEIQEKATFKKEAQLDYYAMLMNQWINGISLNQIINQSIDYHENNKRTIMVGFQKEDLEIFSKDNKKHVNILIGNIIEDIEYVLRFIFEKYFNNYYSMLVEILGDKNAGVNWATFLEYGTRNSIVIALQNYGLSRHSANFIFSTHMDCLIIENDGLIGIEIDRLKKKLNKDNIEYDEIQSILF